MRAFLYSSLIAMALSNPQALAAEPDWKKFGAELDELIGALESVPEGAKLLQEVRAKNPKFREHLRLGNASLTESTFSRSYSLFDGREEIRVRHEITVNQKLRLAESVVDLAHELVHFSQKEMLDPYKEGFELQEFVRRGIEGPGGELDALARECLVAWDLERHYPKFPRHHLCAPFRTAKGGFHREKARRAYYAVGQWMKEVRPALRKGFPEIHGGRVVFTSSYARKPYPVALTEEYESTRKTACENNRRKYRLIAAQSVGDSSGRSIASSSPLEQEKVRLESYERRYCQGH